MIIPDNGNISFFKALRPFRIARNKNRNVIVPIHTIWASPDETTLEDTVKIMKKHDLWEKVSARVRTHLSNPSPEKETPDNFEGKPLHLYMKHIRLSSVLWILTVPTGPPVSQVR